MSAQLNLHRTERELYDGLPAEEEEYEDTVWKSIETDGVRLVFFPAKVSVVEEEQA